MSKEEVPSQTELLKRKEKLQLDLEQLFDDVAEVLFDNTELQTRLFYRIRAAKEALQRKGDVDPESTTTRVEMEVKSIKAILNRERQIQHEEKILRWITPMLIVVYIVSIVWIIVKGGNVWQDEKIVPVIGIPVSILVWAAIGSLAAILYRFYTHQAGRMREEIKWLIARPIIGIVMGSLSYLAILSGLIIFGTTMGLDSDASNARPQILWIIAFLGGFSDKFFERIIAIVVGKLSTEHHMDEPKGSIDL